jgi:hypothetical protein
LPLAGAGVLSCEDRSLLNPLQVAALSA